MGATMLLELYITLQVLCVLILAAAFFSEIPILWAIGGVLAAVLAMSAFGIERTQVVVSNVTTVTVGATDTSTMQYQSFTDQRIDTPMVALNFMLFGVALIFFFYAVYTDIQEGLRPGA